MSEYRVHMVYRDEVAGQMNYTVWIDADTVPDATIRGIEQLRVERGAEPIRVTAEPVKAVMSSEPLPDGFLAELERARQRAALLPRWARPITTNPSPTDAVGDPK